MLATKAELARYAKRARQYAQLAIELTDFSTGDGQHYCSSVDPQVRSVSRQWAIEAQELSAQWAKETRGGL